MAKNQRFFNDGVNDYQGYQVNVTRFVASYANGGQSRIAARHFGTITSPDGETIKDMGESGMTTTDIKKWIAKHSDGDYQARVYNRGAGSGTGDTELNRLIKTKSMLESLGLSTDEVDEKIEAKKSEIEERNRERERNRGLIKHLNSEIAKLEKAKSQMYALRLNTEQVDERIASYERRIAFLRDGQSQQPNN